MKRKALFAFLAVTTLAAFNVNATIVYTGEMSGGLEVPANPSTATGSITVLIDGNMMTVSLDWDGLIGGNPGAAHIHCCTDPGSNIGVAVGFPGFPAAASGTYSRMFDLLDASIYTSGFLTNFGGGTVEGARDALLAGLASGRAYSNIHNSTYPGGEIRADLTQAAQVPEPSTALFIGVGLFVLTRSRSLLRIQ